MVAEREPSHWCHRPSVALTDVRIGNQTQEPDNTQRRDNCPIFCVQKCLRDLFSHRFALYLALGLACVVPWSCVVYEALVLYGWRMLRGRWWQGETQRHLDTVNQLDQKPTLSWVRTSG